MTRLDSEGTCSSLTIRRRKQLFYFSRAAHDWPTGIVAPSPVLERLGLYKAEEQPKEPVSGLGELSSLHTSASAFHLGFPADPDGTEFTRARVKHSWDRPVYGDDEYNKGFVLKGLEVKTHYATAA